ASARTRPTNSRLEVEDASTERGWRIGRERQQFHSQRHSFRRRDRPHARRGHALSTRAERLPPPGAREVDRAELRACEGIRWPLQLAPRRYEPGKGEGGVHRRDRA